MSPVSFTFNVLVDKRVFWVSEFGKMGSLPIECSSANKYDGIKEFRKVFERSNFVVAITGAGISAESGIPTFRGAGGYWRGFTTPSLAAMSKFKENPSLVWEFYHYRREIVLTKSPNSGHLWLAEVEKEFEKKGKKFVIITQNIDELHFRAGSKNVVELHGTLFKTQCMECSYICENYESPICPALLGKGCSEEGTEDAKIPIDLLPRCQLPDCKGLARPYIIWFDEDPTPENMLQSYEWLNKCDLCLVIGTSSLVDPANEFGPYVAKRGVPVAEFNMERTPLTDTTQFHIAGPSGTTLKQALTLE